MYAIIENAGRQYKVSEGDIITIDLRPDQDGDEIKFDKVMLLNDGTAAKVGAPAVAGASVTGTVVGTVKAAKVSGISFRRRHGSKVKSGHRQKYTQVKITGITG